MLPFVGNYPQYGMTPGPGFGPAGLPSGGPQPGPMSPQMGGPAAQMPGMVGPQGTSPVDEAQMQQQMAALLNRPQPMSPPPRPPMGGGPGGPPIYEPPPPQKRVASAQQRGLQAAALRAQMQGDPIQSGPRGEVDITEYFRQWPALQKDTSWRRFNAPAPINMTERLNSLRKAASTAEHERTQVHPLTWLAHALPARNNRQPFGVRRFAHGGLTSYYARGGLVRRYY